MPKTIKRRSSAKQIWEKLTKHNDAKILIKNAWKIEKDKMKEYNEKIGNLHKKYCK